MERLVLDFIAMQMTITEYYSNTKRREAEKVNMTPTNLLMRKVMMKNPANISMLHS